MATVHQFTANIANAQLSTGPRTEEGKQTVARNAVRHGLFTCIDRLHPDDRALVQLSLDVFQRMYPQPDAEIWVHELALAWFRRDRTRALAAPLYACDDEDSIKALDRLHRWERNFTRDIDKVLKILNSLPQSESPAEAAPPQTEIDKTKPIDVPTQPKQSLNSPCACGSGLKYKRCCGTRDRHTPRVTPEG